MEQIVLLILHMLLVRVTYHFWMNISSHPMYLLPQQKRSKKGTDTKKE